MFDLTQPNPVRSLVSVAAISSLLETDIAVSNLNISLCEPVHVDYSYGIYAVQVTCCGTVVNPAGLELDAYVHWFDTLVLVGPYCLQELTTE